MVHRACRYYQPPADGNPIVAVFENPTWREVCFGRPVMGVAGSNLCVLFQLLRALWVKADGFIRGVPRECFYRCKCAIVDGSKSVYSCSKEKSDGKFQSDVAQNADLIRGVLSEEAIVVCFGKRASKAIDIVIQDSEIILKHRVDVCQLSTLGLQRISNTGGLLNSLKLPECMRGMIPLLIVAEYILAKLAQKEVGDFETFKKGFVKSGDGCYPLGFIPLWDDRVGKEFKKMQVNCVDCCWR